MSRRRINRGTARREELRQYAEEIKVERSKRTSEQQLSVLDMRLGTDQGASKERMRLLTLIESDKQKKEKVREKKPQSDDSRKKKMRAKDLRSSQRSRKPSQKNQKR